MLESNHGSQPKGTEERSSRLCLPQLCWAVEGLFTILPPAWFESEFSPHPSPSFGPDAFKEFANFLILSGLPLPPRCFLIRRPMAWCLLCLSVGLALANKCSETGTWFFRVPVPKPRCAILANTANQLTSAASSPPKQNVFRSFVRSTRAPSSF